MVLVLLAYLKIPPFFPGSIRQFVSFSGHQNAIGQYILVCICLYTCVLACVYIHTYMLFVYVCMVCTFMCSYMCPIDDQVPLLLLKTVAFVTPER